MIQKIQKKLTTQIENVIRLLNRNTVTAFPTRPTRLTQPRDVFDPLQALVARGAVAAQQALAFSERIAGPRARQTVRLDDRPPAAAHVRAEQPHQPADVAKAQREALHQALAHSRRCWTHASPLLIT